MRALPPRASRRRSPGSRPTRRRRLRSCAADLMLMWFGISRSRAGRRASFDLDVEDHELRHHRVVAVAVALAASVGGGDLLGQLEEQRRRGWRRLVELEEPRAAGAKSSPKAAVRGHDGAVTWPPPTSCAPPTASRPAARTAAARGRRASNSWRRTTRRTARHLRQAGRPCAERRLPQDPPPRRYGSQIFEISEHHGLQHAPWSPSPATSSRSSRRRTCQPRGLHARGTAAAATCAS